MHNLNEIENLARARIAEVCSSISNKSSYIAMTTCLKLSKDTDGCRKDFSEAISELHRSRLSLHQTVETVKNFSEKIFADDVPEKSRNILSFMEDHVASADTTISSQIEAMQALSAVIMLGVQEIVPSVIYANFNNGCVMVLIMGDKHVSTKKVIDVNSRFLNGDSLDISAYADALRDITENARLITISILDDKQMLESFKDLYDSSRAAMQGGLH